VSRQYRFTFQRQQTNNCRKFNSKRERENIKIDKRHDVFIHVRLDNNHKNPFMHTKPHKYNKTHTPARTHEGLRERKRKYKGKLRNDEAISSEKEAAAAAAAI
jgi:hypothetical protein